MKIRIEECTECGYQAQACGLCGKQFADGDKMYCEGAFGGDHHICANHVFHEALLVNVAEIEA